MGIAARSGCRSIEDQSKRFDLLSPLKSLICGFPERVRRRQRFGMLNLYVDDSGTGTPPVYVLAGYVANVDRWMEFSTRWQALCDEKPMVSYVKMSDAMALKGEFLGWNEEIRDEKLRQFQELTNEVAEYAIAAFVSTSGYADIFRKTIGASFDNEYYFTLSKLIGVTFDIEKKRKPLEQVSFIFDDQGRRNSEEAKLIWQRMLRGAPVWVRQRMGNDPVWGSDLRFLPLQAADMLAWIYRRVAEDLVSPYGDHKQWMQMEVLKQGLPQNMPFDLEKKMWDWGYLAQRASSKSWKPWMNVRVPVSALMLDRDQLQIEFNALRSRYPPNWQHESKKERSKRIERELKGLGAKNFWSLRPS